MINPSEFFLIATDFQSSRREFNLCHATIHTKWYNTKVAIMSWQNLRSQDGVCLICDECRISFSSLCILFLPDKVSCVCWLAAGLAVHLCRRLAVELGNTSKISLDTWNSLDFLVGLQEMILQHAYNNKCSKISQPYSYLNLQILL